MHMWLQEEIARLKAELQARQQAGGGGSAGAGEARVSARQATAAAQQCWMMRHQQMCTVRHDITQHSAGQLAWLCVAVYAGC
jgi:hypothetical protein